MEWTQVLTIIIATVGSTWAFYKITKEDIAVIREQMKEMREDGKAMDAKWERLFERLLLKDQK